ncbi:uncharacterized protein BO96DRAFT_433191 [Aspergillus niger CBS 101883]|uniref:uncharacterized protein n=1 Tax=Aspergillus lacticoffeatus (strain CBS 101883) TaxID=1450533 RepID=UPI000D7F6A19|nr:uncharacterized protein BO96DRAFT_433191 [Aspergillus niger CBS 101883]PYH57744.1 hypothetical protein BO96DRAFT_433191 [Aspergillus niger CBS 101883]
MPEKRRSRAAVTPCFAGPQRKKRVTPQGHCGISHDARDSVNENKEFTLSPHGELFRATRNHVTDTSRKLRACFRCFAEVVTNVSFKGCAEGASRSSGFTNMSGDVLILTDPCAVSIRARHISPLISRRATLALKVSQELCIGVQSNQNQVRDYPCSIAKPSLAVRAYNLCCEITIFVENTNEVTEDPKGRQATHCVGPPAFFVENARWAGHLETWRTSETSKINSNPSTQVGDICRLITCFPKPGERLETGCQLMQCNIAMLLFPALCQVIPLLVQKEARDIQRTYQILIMLLKNISGLLFLVASAASRFSMSTDRYTVPIPEGIIILETRKQLNDMADQYPMGTLDDRNGGYYLLDHDATVLAIASDSLCEELDSSMESAKRFHSNDPISDNEAEDVAPGKAEAANPGLSNHCTHPRCHTHALCRTYSDCYVCSSSFHWCF